MNDESTTTRKYREPLLHGVDWAIHAGATEEVMMGVRSRILRRRRRRLAATTGAMAILAVAGVFWLAAAPVRRSPARVTEEAAQNSGNAVVVSAPEVKILPDGSIVEARKGAEISVDYSANMRRVALMRGDAYFRVAKNEHVPFVVATRGVETRAVGTAFAVQLGESTVEVLVTEGRVAVRKAEDDPRKTVPFETLPRSPETLATVDAGSCVVVNTATLSADIARVADAELRQRMAWRTPLLEFTQTPLSEVVAAMNRRAHIQLILADSRLGEVKISGTLRADNVETLLHLLAGEYGIEAYASAGESISLRARR